jgi:hypothetical protein
MAYTFSEGPPDFSIENRSHNARLEVEIVSAWPYLVIFFLGTRQVRTLMRVVSMVSSPGEHEQA